MINGEASSRDVLAYDNVATVTRQFFFELVLVSSSLLIGAAYRDQLAGVHAT